ncbi:MAG TPA: signal peptidase II [Candidatus Binataceae bacterium]|nr:signal peptidase II [Candidatus Binataceae bacterium]
MIGGLATAPADSPERPRSWTRTLAPIALVSAPVTILDQLSKQYVSGHFRLYQMRPIVPGWLDLTYTLNPGAAFSMFATMPAGFRASFFVVLSAIAIAVLTALIVRRSTTRLSAIAFALVLGGTIGNLIDRLARGLVIDFIYFHHEAFRYPVFNIADSAITVGVAIILLDSWRDGRKAAADAHQTHAENPDPATSARV